LSCEADGSSSSGVSAAACKFPIAKAYDHLDGDISPLINISRVLVDSEGTTFPDGESATCTAPCAKLSDLKNPSTSKAAILNRSTYLFSYDVKDAVGNKAEQVLFALIINDLTAPTITNLSSLDIEIEADSSVTLNNGHNLADFKCTDSKKVDADADLKKTSSRDTAYTWNILAAEDDANAKTCNSSFTTVITCTDHAGFYGKDSATDNSANMTVTTNIKDQTPPVLEWAADPIECDSKKTAAVVKSAIQVTCKDTTKLNDAYDNLDSEIVYEYNDESKASISEITEVLMGENKTHNVTCADDTYPCTYEFSATCTDHCANTHTVEHDITVKDTTPPDVDAEYSGDNYADVDKDHSSAYDNVTKTTTHTFDILPTEDWTAECGSDRHNSSFDISSPVETCSRESGTMFHNQTGFEYVAYDGCDADSCTIDVHNINDGANENMKFHAHAKFSDTCCMKDSEDELVATWEGTPFNPHVAGTYTRRFTIKDCANNTAFVDVKVVLQDRDAPIIHMEGCDADNAICTNVFEASNTDEYTDLGAQCHDYVDGVLSHAVEVSGQVVNMRIIGTYQINYNCADLSGNGAEPVTRTVIIEDKTAPTCFFDTNQGVTMNFVEAGFPYIDAGATMADSLDGNCTTGTGDDACTNSQFGSLTKTGDTVTDGEVFYNYDSCDSIRKYASLSDTPTQPENGQYVISPQGGVHRVLVNCYFGDTTTPAVPALSFLVFFGTDFVTKSPNGDCTVVLGADAVKWTASTNTTTNTMYKTALKESVDFSDKDNKDLLADQTLDGVHSMHGACVIKSTGRKTFQDKDKAVHITNDKAEPGVYRIVFTGEDRAGNECDPITRTVIVRDTLPPVIALFDASNTSTKVFNHPSDGAVGLRGETNYQPGGAAHFKFNQEMAETSSVNGWFIGAVACAVSGVALLATSMKKAATSVPV